MIMAGRPAKFVYLVKDFLFFCRFKLNLVEQPGFSAYLPAKYGAIIKKDLYL